MPSEAQPGLLAALDRLKAGDFPGAYDTLDRLISRFGIHSSFLHLQGVCASSRGQTGNAIALLRRAVEIDTGNARYHDTLAAVLMEIGDVVAAAKHSRRAVKLDSKAAEFRVRLAGVLEANGELEEAAVQYRRALAIDPNNFAARIGRAHTLQIEGDFEEANEEFAKAARIRPDRLEPLIRPVHAHKVESGDPVIAKIESQLEIGGRPVQDMRRLHFAMAKCMDDIGNYARAFHHYRTGNLLKARGQTFTKSDVAHHVERTLSLFSREFFAERTALGSDSDRPVFVVGMPRSGTTLVEQIIARHPEAAGAGELEDINRLALGLSDRVGPRVPYPDMVPVIEAELARNLSEAYLATLLRAGPVARRIVDKMPRNFEHLGLISLLFPRAPIVHCRRNPLDTCLSCYFQDFAAGHPYAYDLDSLGWYYGQYERLMAHWRTVIPNPLIEVTYENLVSDPDTGAREIIKFCDLPWDDACLDPKAKRSQIRTSSIWQARQAVYKTSAGRWQNYDAYLGPLKRALGMIGEPDQATA